MWCGGGQRRAAVGYTNCNGIFYCDLEYFVEQEYLWQREVTIRVRHLGHLPFEHYLIVNSNSTRFAVELADDVILLSSKEKIHWKKEGF